MTRSRLQLVALLLVAPLVVGCGKDLSDPNGGDCNADIGWDGVVYESHNELNKAAPRGNRLGSGNILDCDGSSVGTVEVFGVVGVDSILAIKVIGEWRGVYVAEGTPKASWPKVLKAR